MAREKGPLDRKCLAPRKDHRKSVRPLRNAGKETRGRNKDARKRKRMAMRRGERGGLKEKEEEFPEKEEPCRKTKWRKDKRMSETRVVCFASTKTRPLYHQRCNANWIDKRSFLPSFFRFLFLSFSLFFFYRNRWWGSMEAQWWVHSRSA